MHYVLIVDTDQDQKLAAFRLYNEHGQQLAFHQIKLSEHSPALWEGLFDTRRYIKRYAGNLCLKTQSLWVRFPGACAEKTRPVMSGNL
jgi:hypothetical protein